MSSASRRPGNVNTPHTWENMTTTPAGHTADIRNTFSELAGLLCGYSNVDLYDIREGDRIIAVTVNGPGQYTVEAFNAANISDGIDHDIVRERAGRVVRDEAYREVVTSWSHPDQGSLYRFEPAGAATVAQTPMPEIRGRLLQLVAQLEVPNTVWEFSHGMSSHVSTAWSGAAEWSGPVDDRELLLDTRDAALAEWIAAACPATVLQLLNRIDTLEQQLAAAAAPADTAPTT